MGLNQSANPSAEFVMELLKNMDQDGMEQIARYVVKRLDEKPVIDIPSTETKTRGVQHSFEPNQLFQLLMNNQGLANNSLGPLFELMKGRLKTNSTVQMDDFDDDEDEDDPDLNPPASKTPLPSPSPFGQLFNSFLPEILAIGNEIINPKARTREEVLLEAILPYIPKTQQESFLSLQPAIRLFGVLQSRGIIGKNLFPQGLFSGGFLPKRIFTRGSTDKDSKKSDTEKRFFPKISRKALKNKIRSTLKLKSHKSK